jgi:hypothetical protein
MEDYTEMYNAIKDIDDNLREKFHTKKPQLEKKINNLINLINKQQEHINKMRTSERAMRSSTIQANQETLNKLQKQYQDTKIQLEEFINIARINGYFNEVRQLQKASNDLDDLMNSIGALQLGGKKKKRISNKNKRTSKKTSKRKSKKRHSRKK